MVCYFISPLNSFSSLRVSGTSVVWWRDGDGTHYVLVVICMCTHSICRNQNVLFIHILLWKLMLKYFIAKHCENAGTNVHRKKGREKYLENFISSPFIFRGDVCAALSHGKFCLLSTKTFEGNFRECIVLRSEFFSFFESTGKFPVSVQLWMEVIFQGFLRETFFEVRLQRSRLFSGCLNTRIFPRQTKEASFHEPVNT